jgi:hypothetical protein
VDRPHNGHRRHDTGSITVVDLIRRQQQGPVRIPSFDEADTVQFVDDLLGPEAPPDRPRGWMSKSAKLAGLAFGSLALCGSVVAASTLTHHRADTATVSPVATVLTGAGALRPDTVAAELSGHTTRSRPIVAPASHPAVPSHASGRATGTIVGPISTTTPSAPTATEAPVSQSAVTSHLDAEELVRTFYRLVGTNPSLAASLITPALLASDPTGFDRAWSSMTHIRIEDVEQRSDGTVQAAIRMLEPDGAWLRVVELLHVTDGDDPLITGAELLSAQRG